MWRFPTLHGSKAWAVRSGHRQMPTSRRRDVLQYSLATFRRRTSPPQVIRRAAEPAEETSIVKIHSVSPANLPAALGRHIDALERLALRSPVWHRRNQ